MKEFDLIVIGGGSGLNVAAAAEGKVALIEEGPMGGTCLNRGCIPSKVIIHSADVMELIRDAGKFDIKATGKHDFAGIIKRASLEVDKESRQIEEGLRASGIEVIKGRAKFTGPKTLAVGNKQIKADKIVIAAGGRPVAPPIAGLDKVDYITSDEALRLKKQPKSMIVVGGGFIAAELAHFYGSLGTKITISQRSVMLREEDREIADAYTAAIRKKYNVVLGWSPVGVSQKGRIISLVVEKDKKQKTLTAEMLLVATGRTPNTDVLDVKKSNIDTDEKGYIKTNDYLETNVPGIWAFGDIAGKYLLKHSANLEAKYIVNALAGRREKVNYWPMPHAIFTSPQIAAVGYTEEELKEQKTDYVVGKHMYKNTGMGLALAEKDGFAKILVERETHRMLGCHIIGPDASAIIHEVIVAMKFGATVEQLAETTHIHPALPEVVQRAAAAAVKEMQR